MLRIFRNARSKLFNGQKFQQYLFYAVGEVLLVIVGILIAVSLNNANERRKERNEVDSLLRQVQAELDTNIGRMDGLYTYYGLKDSLIYNYLNEVVPSQQLDDRKIGIYISLSLNYNAAEIESDAYEALMKKAEYFPSEYAELIQNLKTIYRQGKNDIEGTLDLINQYINDEIDYLSATQAWYTDLFYRSKLSPEVKPFILNDIRFINRITDYSNLSHGNLTTQALNFKEQAVAAYRQIDELLQSTDKVADSKASFEYDMADFKSWLGKYRDPSDSDTLQILEVQGKLRFKWQSNDFEIFPLNNREFTISTPYYLKMDYNADGSVKQFSGHYPNKRFVYEKLD